MTNAVIFLLSGFLSSMPACGAIVKMSAKVKAIRITTRNKLKLAETSPGMIPSAMSAKIKKARRIKSRSLRSL